MKIKLEHLAIVAAIVVGLYLAKTFLLSYISYVKLTSDRYHLLYGKPVTFTLTCEYYLNEGGKYTVKVGDCTYSYYWASSGLKTDTCTYKDSIFYTEGGKTFYCEVTHESSGEKKTASVTVCFDRVENLRVSPTSITVSPGQKYTITVELNAYSYGACATYNKKIYIDNNLVDSFSYLSNNYYKKSFELTAPSNPGTYTKYVRVKTYDDAFEFTSTSFTVTVTSSQPSQQFGYEFVYRWIGQVLSLIKEALSLIKPI
ncbi:MAG: hypothetical protein ACP5G1_01605 [Nanopusillaceae archaeon]